MKLLTYTASLILVCTAFYTGQSKYEHYQLVNQESIAHERFKSTQEYAYQQGQIDMVAEMIETAGKLSYNPAYVVPQRKPEQMI